MESGLDTRDPSLIRVSAIENYHHFCNEFLQALTTRYDGTVEGEMFREQQLKYDMAITHNFNLEDKNNKKEKLVEVFYTQVQPYFADVNRGSLDAIATCEFAQNMGLSSIVKTADNETKEVVCEYLKNMIQCAVMWSVYKNIPTKLLECIGNAAADIEKNKTPLDMRALSSRILQDIGHEDIRQFAANMVQNPDALADLCSLAASSTIPM